MALKADGTSRTVWSNEMRYREGRPEVREYDACYYEIGTVDPNQLQSQNLAEKSRIYVEFTQANDMNVYIYGGKNRFEATEEVVSGNSAVKLNRNYTIDISKGFLIVAYPNKDVETTFEFKYYVAPYNEQSWQEMIQNWDFNSNEGDSVFLIFIIAVAVALICVLCFLFCCFKRCVKKNSRIEIFDDEANNHPIGTSSPRANGGNDTSVQLEELDDGKGLSLSANQKTNNGKNNKVNVELTGEEKIADGKRYSLAKQNDSTVVGSTQKYPNPFDSKKK